VLLNSNHRHRASCFRSFAAIAEEQIRAACSAQVAHVNLFFRHAGIDQLPAVRGAQIELHARRRRHMPRRHHRQPRQPERLLAMRQLLERPVKPVRCGRKLRCESLRDFGADFVAAAANRRRSWCCRAIRKRALWRQSRVNRTRLGEERPWHL